MDFDFIAQLYYGNINPNVRDMSWDSALGKASKAFSDAEEELTNALTGAEKKALLNLLMPIRRSSARKCLRTSARAFGWARWQSWISWPGQTSFFQRIEHFIHSLKRRRTDGKCLFFAVFIGQKKTID